MAFRPPNIKAIINLKVLAGVAKPNPKMGQSLGPLGINMMHFCKDFNAQTSQIRPDVPLRVKLSVFEDRSYKYVIKPPETSWFIRRLIGKNKFTGFPGHIVEGQVSIKNIYEISKIKQEMDPDLKNQNLESICKCIIAQCTSMGVQVVMDTEEKPEAFSPVIKM